MKHWKIGSISFLIVALAFAGCAKKSTEQASITGTGFDSSTEELAQLPQASTASQQAGVEVLPIETSPITQGVPPIAGPTQRAAATAMETAVSAASSTASSLSREQQIQTALTNAGLYSGSIDGKIGPASKRAIEEFQKNNNLKVDGKVGPKTWAALETYLAGSGHTGSASTGTTTASAD
jgi:peptidoglycan hydrolase-like protein with peptidoglycan-binding domain